MADYDNHTGVLELLKKSQSVESDVRDKVREVDIFLNSPSGQWEDDVVTAFKNRPRYTFDKCNDLVDDIAGEIEQADFDITIKPAGGDATKDIAKTANGLVRNIENLSNAVDLFNDATRQMVGSGFDAWRVNQRWGDNNTFDQDLYIDPISDAGNSVWVDFNSDKQTREDAEWLFVLQSMGREIYKEKFPEGSEQSISTDTQTFDSSGNEPEVIVIGEFMYKTRVKRRIVEMNNGSVYVDDEKYQAIKDELQAQGVVEKRNRMREFVEVKTRLLDGSDWLTDVQDTVFEHLPVVPVYGNWSVTKKVPSYWGIVTKKMDAQRVLNYTESRKVEETALAPLAKIMVTQDQIGPYDEQWKNLNVSTDPALPYVSDDRAKTPPYKLGGAELNPGLESVSMGMKEHLVSTAGLDLLAGQSPGVQSGVAVELKQNKGDTRNFKYTISKRKAVCYTGKILMTAIPKVYDTARQVRIINEDQSFDIVTLNETIIDDETQKEVTINDLSVGAYDVTCVVGPAFKNRQQETAQAFSDIAAIDPSIIQEGKDIWYSNLTFPGMDAMAERVRKQMVVSGQIPEEQLTDDEKEFLGAQPEPPPDPVAVALEREADNADDKITLEGMKFEHQERMDQARLDGESMKDAIDQIKGMAEVLNKHADTWDKMRKAMGLETISGPGGIKAFIEQGGVIRETQAEQP